MAHLGLNQRAANEVRESFMGIAAILLLGAMSARDEQYAAILVEALTGESSQAGFDTLMERLRSGEIEAQLHGGGDFVDILAAGAGSADEAQLEIGVRDLNLS